MVCKDCLREHWGGSEKSCSHGWDLVAGKPRTGTCSKCGKQADSLHCPDGSIAGRTVCIECGGSPAPFVFEHGTDGPYCMKCVNRANAAPPETSVQTFRPGTGSIPPGHRAAEDPHPKR